MLRTAEEGKLRLPLLPPMVTSLRTKESVPQWRLCPASDPDCRTEAEVPSLESCVEALSHFVVNWSRAFRVGDGEKKRKWLRPWVLLGFRMPTQQAYYQAPSQSCYTTRNSFVVSPHRRPFA